MFNAWFALASSGLGGKNAIGGWYCLSERPPIGSGAGPRFIPLTESVKALARISLWVRTISGAAPGGSRIALRKSSALDSARVEGPCTGPDAAEEG